MKYLVRDSERKGSCYHEFMRGKWDGETFWKKDSLSLHDDILDKCGDFTEALLTVIPTYDPFSETEISYEQWKMIGEIIAEKSKMAEELYKEIDEWAKDTFETYNCFTILGI